MKTFDKVVTDVYKELFSRGVWQRNKRTDTQVLAMHGYSFTWDMNFWPLLMVRRLYPKTAASEVAWFISGEKSTKWINKRCGIWRQFEDTPGMIESAYGFRWRYMYGIDQLYKIIANLKADKSSRQQVLLSWHPKDLKNETKNVPCPYTAVFNIIEGKLNCHLTLRSNDLYLGLPYDTLMYTILSNLIANSVGVDVGELFYSIAHAHIYENQLDAVNEVRRRATIDKQFPMNIGSTVEFVRDNRDLFVNRINVPGYDAPSERIFGVGVVV